MTLCVAVLGTLSFSMLMLSTSASREAARKQREVASLYVAQAGLSEATRELAGGGAGVLGSEEQPRSLGGSAFWVESVDVGNGMTSLVATGQDGLAETRLELVLRETSTPFYRWAAFGEEALTMDSNAQIDSYDSDLGVYGDQDDNGSGSNMYANPNGHVGSNGDIGLDSNVKVWGDAVPGPGQTTTVLGNAEVSGSTTPNTELQEMPALEIPVGISSGDLDIPGGDTTSLIAGTYFYDNATVNGRLEIEGPAVLVLESMSVLSNAEVIIDATGGSVEIYVVGDFVMNSNTLITSTTYTPADVTILLNSDNIIDPDVDVDLDEIDFNSNAQLYGTIYAPRASVEINSNFELFGAVMARRVHLDSNARVHFDEALLEIEDDESTDMEVVCWRVVPHSYAAAVPVGEPD